MADDERTPRLPGYMTEDLQPRIVSGPAEYNDEPSGPVVVSVVHRKQTVMGYLWADDAGDAAGFVSSADGGPAAINQFTVWLERLRDAKARGLTPRQALDELIATGATERDVPGPLGSPVPFEQITALGWNPPPSAAPNAGRR
jgi:hypothetical protein